MAVAQVLMANASDCVKPFAVPDRWIERRDDKGVVGYPLGLGADVRPVLREREQQGRSCSRTNPIPIDEYVPPAGDDPGLGFQAAG